MRISNITAALAVSLALVACESEPPDVAVAIPSLTGTEADCEDLRLDGDGRLMPNEGLRFCIDYFLTGLGETTPLEVRRLFVAEIERRHPEQLERATELYDRYTSYLQEAQRIAESSEAGESMAARRAAVREARTKVLGEAMARAFFDPSPDPTPEGVLRSHHAVALMRSLGESEARIDDLRRAELGVDAAARLRALDTQRAEFERRYRDYRRAKAELDEASPEATERLRTARFTEPERVRVRALDRLR